MRVYEFAKQRDMTSKEILALLKKGGHELASHMSVLTDDAVSFLEKSLSGPEKKKVEPKKAPEKKVNLAPPAKKETKPKAAPAARTHSASSRKRVKRSKRRVFKEKRRPRVQEIKNVTDILVETELPLFKVARMMGKSEAELILALLKKGVPCNRNHVLSVQEIIDMADLFGIRSSVSKSSSESLEESRLEVDEITSKGDASRWPIVVVMGHVDHGKTSLLDYVRNMNTAAKEKGGITQHLSAYEVDSAHGKIIFLDTPGHEAFSYMRKRGTSVTDLVVLIVAADDGIMPQTVEVIEHAKAAGVPIIVAINKIDKVPDRVVAIEKIKRELAQYDLLPEDWGGKIICVPISAKTGEGVEELLEMLVLQSQMMDLKANPDSLGRGFILESRQEKGFGPVATVVCLNGTIKEGDFFVCGSSVGKVRILRNCFGERISFAGPSIPVQVVGFDNFVSLGDWLNVVSQQVYLKEKSSRRKGVISASVDIGGRVDRSVFKFVPIIIKTDTHGSKEAVLGALDKINEKCKSYECCFQVVFSGIGDVSVRDVDLAEETGGAIIGLHVKAEKNAVVASKEQGVDIRTFEIIYKMTEDLEKLLKEHEEEIIVLNKSGEATVRKVFPLKNKTAIAGCYVSDGKFARGHVVKCIRNGKEVGSGKILSLQKEKQVVKEVISGQECGFVTDNFQNWEVGDTVHSFIEEKKKKSEA